jgi:hypothetical protein
MIEGVPFRYYYEGVLTLIKVRYGREVEIETRNGEITDDC